VNDSSIVKSDAAANSTENSTVEKPNQPIENPNSIQGWPLVQRLVEQGRSQVEIKEALKQAGHDEESAQVLINAQFGKNPEELPSANLGTGTNPMSPNLFSFSELGMQGKPSVVASYYVVFGMAIALMVGFFFLMVEMGLVDEPQDFSLDALKALLGLGGVTFVWGALKWFGAVNIKRRE
jgi:hypothetical protein